eukprot:gene7020-9590_t
MWSQRFLLALLFLLILSVSNFSSTSANKDDKPVRENIDDKDDNKKKQKNWDKIKTEDIEKSWEKGDEEDELEFEFERNRKIHQQKMPKFNMEDGASIQRAVKENPFAFSGNGGQLMVFIDLKKELKLSKENIDHLAGKWSGLLRSASLPSIVYNLGDHAMMVNIEKGWLAKDVMKFISLQPEVESFNANSKTYHPKDFIDNDEDDD